MQIHAGFFFFQNIPQELQKFKDDLTSSAEDVKLYGDYW